MYGVKIYDRVREHLRHGRFTVKSSVPAHRSLVKITSPCSSSSLKESRKIKEMVARESINNCAIHVVIKFAIFVAGRFSIRTCECNLYHGGYANFLLSTLCYITI